MVSIKDETVKGVKWTAIEKFSVQMVQFLLGLLMARLLTPEDYGTIGLITIFIAVSNTFIDSGFANALIRKLDRTEDDYCTTFYFNVAISLACYIMLFFGSNAIARFFDVPILSSIVRVHALTLIVNSLVGVQVTKLTIELNFKAIAQRGILAVVISGLVGLFMAYEGYGVWALVGQSIANSVTNFVFIGMYCHWIPKRHFSVPSFKGLFSYGSRLLAAGLLNTIYENLSSLVIGKYYTSKDLGMYSRGVQIAVFPVHTVNSILSKVTFPLLAKIQDDEGHLMKVYRKYICITSMIIFFGCTLLAAIGRPLVLLLLTDKWESCVIFLQLFCFAIMFDHICRINLNLLQIKGRSDLFLRLEIIKKTLSTMILFASIPFGVVGICASKIIYSQLAVFINTYYTGKLFNLGYLAQLKDYSGYFLSSVLACVPAYLLTLCALGNLLSVILGSAVSLGLYCFFLRKDPLFQELLNDAIVYCCRIIKK